jgi:BASS family bile acid:Na+ symporter
MMEYFLPLGLGFIMFALGLSLTLDDFRSALGRPGLLLLGLVAQVILLPLTAFLLASALNLPPAAAVGLMILSACPGGVMAGVVTYLARGETAISISLSAITSLLAIFTVPLVVGFGLRAFLGAATEVHVPVIQMMVGLLLVTVLPVSLGLWLKTSGRATARAQIGIRRFSGALFALMVLHTLLVQGPTVAAHLPAVGLACLLLNLLTMATGAAIAALAGADTRARLALAMECGFQNSALGITLATALLAQPALAVPSAVYSVLMYITALAVIGWRRRPKSA